MPQSAQLAFGARTLAVRCPSSADLLTVDDPAPLITPDLFKERIEQFLSAAKPDLRRPAVVVADKTRLCGYPHYLPVLLKALADHGARLDRLRIYIAYGTHARQSDDESRKAYGAVYDQYQWVHHRCDDEACFVPLGHTPRGTPVRLRSDLLQASFLITFGAISHHYFAGYGGGRKLIFPGLGQREAIYRNHALFLDPIGRQLARGCRPGRLIGNPLAEDLADYASHLQAHMAIHAILDSHGAVCDLLVGQGRDHFLSACARHGAYCEVTSGVYDLVLASCGGFPKDINLIQSHKAIHNAAAFVRDGGRLVMLAQCADGIGSDTFLPWFDMGGREAAFDALARQYVGNGGTALAMMEKTSRIAIHLVSDLPSDLCAQIGVSYLPASGIQAMVDDHSGSLAVLPNASLLVRAPQVP